MELEYSVDLISDLNLSKTEQFVWTGKPTSLFCIVSGNISSDTKKIREVLEHLGTLYRGVLYIDGQLEHTSIRQHRVRIERLEEICKPLKNVVYMHNHVVVLNGIAFVAVNGWYGKNYTDITLEDSMLISHIQNEDIAYLSKTVRDLQLHGDISKIVVISNSIPSDFLLYSKIPTDFVGMEPGISLVMDTGSKVSHWLYGGPHPIADVVYNGRRFTNNPCIAGQPYWPKRIAL